MRHVKRVITIEPSTQREIACSYIAPNVDTEPADYGISFTVLESDLCKIKGASAIGGAQSGLMITCLPNNKSGTAGANVAYKVAVNGTSVLSSGFQYNATSTYNTQMFFVPGVKAGDIVSIKIWFQSTHTATITFTAIRLASVISYIGESNTAAFPGLLKRLYVATPAVCNQATLTTSVITTGDMYINCQHYRATTMGTDAQGSGGSSFNNGTVSYLRNLAILPGLPIIMGPLGKSASRTTFSNGSGAAVNKVYNLSLVKVDAILF